MRNLRRDRVLRRAGNMLLAAGGLTMLLGLFASAASGVDAGPDYQDRNYQVSGNRRFASGGDRTTFTFQVTGDEPADYFIIRACGSGADFVRGFGPDDQQPAPAGTDEATGHDGVKWEPGNMGTYTAVFGGNVGGAEFIVKNGDGHKHYHLGSGCPEGTEVTTSSKASPSSSTTTTEPKSTTTDGPTTTTDGPTTTTDAPTTTTDGPTTTTDGPTTTTDGPTTTTDGPTTTTDGPTTTTDEPTTTTDGPTTTTDEPTTTTDAPTTTTDAPTTTTDAGSSITVGTPTSATMLAASGHTSGPRTGSPPATKLLLAGLPLALSGVAIRFGERDDGRS